MTTAAAIAEAQEASDEVRFWKQTCFVKKIISEHILSYFPILVLLCVGWDLSHLVLRREMHLDPRAFEIRSLLPGREQRGGQFP